MKACGELDEKAGLGVAEIASLNYVTTCSHKGSPLEDAAIGGAKASLSVVVEAAEHGEPTTITKHGRPVAGVVPIGDARRLYPSDRPSFVELLRAIPEQIEFERDSTPFREADL